MLIFNRKEDESVIITTPTGERVKVMVMEVMQRKAKLGIDAPGVVTINREEIQDKIDAEHRADLEFDANREREMK